MNQEGNDNEILYSYLNETLPTLGLDPETYSPYVMGCLSANDSGNDDEENVEDLDQIMELLCASSETHSDDETGVWVQFKSEVLKHHEEHRNILREKKDAELEDLRKAEEMRRQKEIETLIEAQREMESRKQQESDVKEMSAAKKALLDQYAYDTSEQFDNDGNLIDPNAATNSKGGKGNKKGGEGEEEVLTNRAAAQKASEENAQSLRKAQSGGTTKKTEQMKTKAAKLDKMKQKEERRKRAGKGERKR